MAEIDPVDVSTEAISGTNRPSCDRPPTAASKRRLRWNVYLSSVLAGGRLKRGAPISNSLAINTIGVAAALCSMTSFVPQAFKIIKARDASSVSLQMYIVTVAGFTLWTAYGIGLKSWPLIGSNAVSLGLSSIILGLKIWMPSAKDGG